MSNIRLSDWCLPECYSHKKLARSLSCLFSSGAAAAGWFAGAAKMSSPNGFEGVADGASALALTEGSLMPSAPKGLAGISVRLVDIPAKSNSLFVSISRGAGSVGASDLAAEAFKILSMAACAFSSSSEELGLLKSIRPNCSLAASVFASLLAAGIYI